MQKKYNCKIFFEEEDKKVSSYFNYDLFPKKLINCVSSLNFFSIFRHWDITCTFLLCMLKTKFLTM